MTCDSWSISFDLSDSATGSFADRDYVPQMAVISLKESFESLSKKEDNNNLAMGEKLHSTTVLSGLLLLL